MDCSEGTIFHHQGCQDTHRLLSCYPRLPTLLESDISLSLAGPGPPCLGPGPPPQKSINGAGERLKHRERSKIIDMTYPQKVSDQFWGGGPN